MIVIDKAFSDIPTVTGDAICLSGNRPVIIQAITNDIIAIDIQIDASGPDWHIFQMQDNWVKVAASDLTDEQKYQLRNVPANTMLGGELLRNARFCPDGTGYSDDRYYMIEALEEA